MGGEIVDVFEALGELISSANNVAVKDKDISKASYYEDEDDVFRDHPIITVRCKADHLLRLNEVLEQAQKVYRRYEWLELEADGGLKLTLEERYRVDSEEDIRVFLEYLGAGFYSPGDKVIFELADGREYVFSRE